jgi:dTDP-4-dehydrorhamnose reductase
VKILLFGCNGQVGWELQRSLAVLGEVLALGSSRDGPWCGDFLDPAGIEATVLGVKPDVVVNAAAYTAVDRAEGDAERAMQVNALTPGVIAAAAQQVGAALVHYSTDYVFDGSGTRAWREDDPTGPLSVYGRTKLAGEQRIAAGLQRHAILRTSWVYAARGGNFAKTMLRLARERSELKVVDDQFGAPTGADLLADLTAHVVRGLLADARKAGTYHVAAAGETNWHDYARFVVGKARQLGEILQAGPEQVLPVPSSAFPTPARRPHNSRLATDRFTHAFDVALPHWQPGVARMLQEVLQPKS